MILKSKISGLFWLLVSLLPASLNAQQFVLRGSVSDSLGNQLVAVSISLKNTTYGSQTDNNGSFIIILPANTTEGTIVLSRIGLKTREINFKLQEKETFINITLSQDVRPLGEITVRSGSNDNESPLRSLPVSEIRLLPSPSGSFEAILKTMPGVSSNNELSSQYSVRGGNYDENLVYVNDIEIFRPFLIRSGQQEGLSFINSDLVSSIKFSSGGFTADYGDRMSSVLDIKYKTPVSNKGSVKAGLLTSSAYYEGITKNHRLSYIIGARYKSSRLMLKTLDSKGDYQPVFADIQSLVKYTTRSGSSFSLLSAYSSNIYNFVPQSRESSFGNEIEAYRLYVLFAGREKDRYKTLNTSLTWSTPEGASSKHKLILSTLISSEKESFDIRGMYSLNSLDKNYGSNNMSDSLMNIGIGSWLSHARNNLYAVIVSVTYRGQKDWGKASMNWGMKIRSDNFEDRIREWTKTDSAGYSVPTGKDRLLVTNLVSSENSIRNWMYDGYMNVKGFLNSSLGKITLNAGIRAFYNSYTKELLPSPRFFASLEATKNTSFHISGGVYFQPPFYREMRFPDGSLNSSVKSQKSVHIVAGFNYYFEAWGRPFAFNTEVYNKSLSNIIPYRLDNVRIIYSAENTAGGYSRGIEMRINGEFVEGAESWISLSLMDSKLKIPSAMMGYFPSPSDQTININIFFQDYLPGYPTWRAHLIISYVTGIPIISPYNDRYDQYHRLPDYRRVDLGVTKVIRRLESGKKDIKYFRYVKELIAGAEVYNLMDINNTISYLWIRTVNNLSGDTRQYAVPNFLTGRSLNLSLTATF